MKTAEEWLEVSKKIALELMKLPKIDNLTQAVDNSFAIKLFKQIQLDAYKAGMTEAAEIVINPEEMQPINLIEENTLKACNYAILSERDKKETI